MGSPSATPPVAHLLCSFGYGGAELVAAGLVKRARGRGERVRLLGLRGGAVERGLRSEQGLWLEGPEGRRPDEPNGADARAFALRSLLTLGGEVVHAHLPWPDRLATALLGRGRRPAVLTFHLLPPELPDRGDQIVGDRLSYRAMLAAAARVAPLVLVGVTRADAARLRERFPGHRVAFVANTPAEPGGEAAAPLPFGPGLRLLAVGRMAEQKGFDRLLRALAEPRVLAAPWTLCLLGDGAERPRLEALARSLGLADRARFVGSVKALPHYANADLFLTTSHFEGMPLSLLEAMTAGCSVLASPIAPHREVLEGIDGSLLPGDEAAWPGAIEALLQAADRRAEIAAAARRRARDDYGPEAQDRAYGDLYRALRPGGA